MQVISFNTPIRFIYNNQELFVCKNNTTTLDIRSKEGELLQYLRRCSYNSFYILKPFCLYHTKAYKKLSTYKLHKYKIAKMLSIIRLPNLNEWNKIKNRIKQHL
jgi:hypothetical protein